MEAALGVSYVGKRALVCMKHVGMNVCADAFVNSAITGVNGGIVVLAADDPSMHSSQNEQDSRFYGKFAMIPILEPSSQQEAYDMMKYAFELSERREASGADAYRNSYGAFWCGSQSEKLCCRGGLYAKSLYAIRLHLFPANARRRYQEVVRLQPQLMRLSETSVYNKKTGLPVKEVARKGL